MLFPGSGGLCVEAMKHGAKVYTLEERERFHKSLSAVQHMTTVVFGKSFALNKTMEGFKKGPKLDIIIWSEGLHELRFPQKSIEEAYNLLKPNGRLFLEVVHGQHGPPLESGSNTWFPKEEIFVNILAASCKSASVKIHKGRLERRLVYEITKPPAVVTEVVQEVKVRPKSQKLETIKQVEARPEVKQDEVEVKVETQVLEPKIEVKEDKVEQKVEQKDSLKEAKELAKDLDGRRKRKT